jgi:hypothetical protein
MYFQDIIISPDIFKKISKAFSIDSNEELDLKSYVENLKLKRLVLDNDEENETSLFVNTIKELYCSSSDLGKKKLDLILNMFITPGKMKYINTSNFQNILSSKEHNYLLNLGMLSESKIINSEIEELKSCLLIFKNLSDIEILSFEETIKPKNNSGIYCYEKKLEFAKGKLFKYEKYFLPYLADTKSLIVEDRYLRKKEGGFLNLMKILKICPCLDKLIIKTITRENNLKDNFDITVNDLSKKIKTQFPQLEPIIYGTNEHKREMISDNFLFEIDPGFDFVDNEYITRNNVTIHISQINA